MKKVYLFVFCFLSVITAVNAQQIPDFKCGVNDDAQMTEKIRRMMQNPNLRKYSGLRTNEWPLLECLVAVTIDKRLFDFYKGDKELIKNRVYDLFSQVSKLYEKELRVKLTVSHIEFWENRQYTNLYNFDEYWDKIDQSKVKRHLTHLLTLSSVEAGASGMGYLGGNAASSGYATQTSQVINTIAHEIGHNFGSPHTQSCFWSDGPIDLCATVEDGNCTVGDITEARVGTVMSYCGWRVFTFHALCIDLMRNYIDEWLVPINAVPTIPVIPTGNLHLTETSLTPVLNWNYSDGMQKYQIQLSETPAFDAVFIDSTLTYNQFQAFNLKEEKTYFWRVKAINDKGASQWSANGELKTRKILGVPDTPVQRFPMNHSEDINVANFSFYPSPTATEYDIQIMNEWYSFAADESTLITVKDPFLTIDLYKDAEKYNLSTNTMYIWRVRAKNSTGTSKWSGFYHLKRGMDMLTMYPLPYKNDVPTNAVFTWQARDLPFNKRVELEVSTASDFSTNSISKIIALNQLNTIGIVGRQGLGMMDLKPNTQYYYRLKSSEDKSKIWASSSFKTVGDEEESKKWKFFNSENSILNAGRPVSAFYMQPNTNNILIAEGGIKTTDGVNWKDLYNSLNTKGAINYEISGLVHDNKGNVWATSAQKIIKLNEKGSLVFNADKSIFTNYINKLVVDKKDNVYVSVSKDYNWGTAWGVDFFKFDGTSWEQFNSPFSTGGSSYFGVDSDDNLWVCNQTQLARRINNTWTYYNFNKITYEYIEGVYPDKAGNLWVIGNMNMGILHPDGSFSSASIGYPTDNAYLAFDKDNTPYLVNNSNNGTRLFRYEYNDWTPVTKNTLALEANRTQLMGMQFDRSNRLWIVPQHNGIFVYDPKGTVRSQTISTETVPAKFVTDVPFLLNTTASSGLPVKFTILSGPASIAGNQVSLNGTVGKVVVRASQDGNEDFEPAKYVDFSFEVNDKQTQSITVNAVMTKTVGDAPFLLTAISSSGLPVMFSVVSGPATINNNTINLTGAGKITVKAVQTGNEAYFAAKEVVFDFCVKPAIPGITADSSNPFLLKTNGSTNNQWYLNGQKIVGATGNSYLSDKNGSFTVEAINPDATCPSSVSEVFKLLVLANEEAWTKEIKIFPNPFSSRMSVTLPSGISLQKLTIYNVSGKRVYESNKADSEYDTSTLPSGVFFIDIQTNKGRALKRVVKE
ncbi:M12 family metallo-peptidase [Emticicia sp. C21]|uniref:M12 family metallo-peptidase n=1 Tax=Emticicia sp. C21 TaxID=2302915 RepID=UPI001313F35B|nr:M12 family metallo-peptidase [Emticicia sp. C21]